MNFLFATVLVLLIVAPALTFFRVYYSGKFSIRYTRLTITDQVFRSIIPGITIQILAIIVINYCTNYNVRLDIIGILLLGPKDDKSLKECFEIINNSIVLVTCYHIGMLILALLLGWIVRITIRHLKLDRKWRWLRYDNPWYYLLTGEVLETKDFEAVIEINDAKKIDFVFVDALTKVEAGDMLYSGILADYELGEDGSLKNIYLRGAHRKLVENPTNDEISKPKPVNYYMVSGHILVIPFEQISNLNITYWIDDEDARTEVKQSNNQDSSGEVKITGIES